MLGSGRESAAALGRESHKVGTGRRFKGPGIVAHVTDGETESGGKNNFLEVTGYLWQSETRMQGF
jgi:hypothetical protein